MLKVCWHVLFSTFPKQFLFWLPLQSSTRINQRWKTLLFPVAFMHEELKGQFSFKMKSWGVKDGPVILILFFFFLGWERWSLSFHPFCLSSSGQNGPDPPLSPTLLFREPHTTMDNLDIYRFVPGTREINMNEQMISALKEFTVIEA